MDNAKLLEILKKNLEVNKRISDKLEEIDAILIEKLKSKSILYPEIKLIVHKSLKNLIDESETLLDDLMIN